MSHELRTPVSAIVGFLELLAKPELNVGQRKEAIELAGSTAQTLLGLIGNILDIDKIESGKYRVTPQWSDVAQLVSQQCHTFDALAQQRASICTTIMRCRKGPCCGSTRRRYGKSSIISSAMR